MHVRSVQRWRQAWREDGTQALASKGAASVPLLTDEMFARVEVELARGAAAHGWSDGRWTLDRIRILIWRQCAVPYTVQGVAALLKRRGWRRQSAARRVGSGSGLAAGWVKEG